MLEQMAGGLIVMAVAFFSWLVGLVMGIFSQHMKIKNWKKDHLCYLCQERSKYREDEEDD